MLVGNSFACYCPFFLCFSCYCSCLLHPAIARQQLEQLGVSTFKQCQVHFSFFHRNPLVAHSGLRAAPRLIFPREPQNFVDQQWQADIQGGLNLFVIQVSMCQLDPIL